MATVPITAGMCDRLAGGGVLDTGTAGGCGGETGGGGAGLAGRR
jgi:hypothetical protein